MVKELVKREGFGFDFRREQIKKHVVVGGLLATSAPARFVKKKTIRYSYTQKITKKHYIFLLDLKRSIRQMEPHFSSHDQ